MMPSMQPMKIYSLEMLFLFINIERQIYDKMYYRINSM